MKRSYGIVCRKTMGAICLSATEAIFLTCTLAGPFTLLWVIFLLAMESSRPTSVLAQTVGHCLYECETSTCADFGNQTDFCLKRRAECQVKCSKIKFWGAIAYSAKDKGAGWSFGWNDLDKAKNEAMNRCSKQGAACRT